MTFGERLQHLMAEQHLTQVELARLMDVPQQSISRWVNSELPPRMSSVQRIAQALEVSTSRLLSDEEPKKARTYAVTRTIKLPLALSNQLEKLAADSGESLNDVVVDKIEKGIGASPLTPLLSAALSEALADVMEYAQQRGVKPEEALAALVQSALAPGSKPIHFFVIDKMMTIGQMRSMFSAAAEALGTDENFFFRARGMSLDGVVMEDSSAPHAEKHSKPEPTPGVEKRPVRKSPNKK